ncbi:MAG: hypothetical protein K0R38_5781 [Polyangiaceae bacterium]|jgi:hypothetical protein|nr:hypothetical protein [Polyangiaceae bacterium]
MGGLSVLEAFPSFAPKLVAGLPADWSFLHDGSGGTLIVFQHRLPQNLFENSFQTAVEGTQEGAHIGASVQDPERWRYDVSDAGGNYVFGIEGGSTEGAKWIAGSFGLSSTPNAQLFEDGILVGSANGAGAPATTAGNLPLTLGGGRGPHQMVHEVLVYDRVLDSTDVEQLKAYFAAQL